MFPSVRRINATKERRIEDRAEAAREWAWDWALIQGLGHEAAPYTGRQVRGCAHVWLKRYHACRIRWRAGDRLWATKGLDASKMFTGWMDHSCWLAITSDGSTHILHLRIGVRSSSGSAEADSCASHVVEVNRAHASDGAKASEHKPSNQRLWMEF